MPKNNGLPDRWLDYNKMGKIVRGTRFLPIKVPLQSSFAKFLSPESQFTPEDVMQLCKAKNIVIGLIIDLTFTTRYYSPFDFTKNHIQHEKIFFPGRQLPGSKIIKQFNRTVNEFLENNADNNKIILVHCTHGINRTGYLICKYMIDEMKLPPLEVISSFNQARGHDIERDIYLNDLNSSSSTFSQMPPRNRSNYMVPDRYSMPQYHHRGQSRDFYKQRYNPDQSRSYYKQHQNRSSHQHYSWHQHPQPEFRSSYFNENTDGGFQKVTSRHGFRNRYRKNYYDY